MLGKGLESLIPSGTKKPDNNQAGLIYQNYTQPSLNTAQELPLQTNIPSYGANTIHANQETAQNNYPPFYSTSVPSKEPFLNNYQAPVVGVGMSAFLSGNNSANAYPAQPSNLEVKIPEVAQEKPVYSPENAGRRDFYQESQKYATYDKNPAYGELSAKPTYETIGSSYNSQPLMTAKEAAIGQPPATYETPVYNPPQIVTPPAAPPAYAYAEINQGTLTNNKPEDYSNTQGSVFQIEVEKIFPNPHQPRKYFDEAALTDLANSIREFGIIQPLVVTKIIQPTESGEDVTYQLIAGERRLQAAKKIGLRTVPAVIKQITMDRERLELAIIENVQREDLNPLETARSYSRLQDEFGLTQREIAVRMGKSRETVANTLRLLNLPTEIQQAIESSKINESHARILLQVTDPRQQQEMFESIIRFKPTVRELKAKIRYGKSGSNQGLGFGGVNPELIAFQSRLEEVLGTKVQIVNDGGKGKITINYYSAEELNDLINILSGGKNF